MELVDGQTHRSVGQNREPERDPRQYTQLTSDKDIKIVQCRKDSPLNK